MNDPTNDASRNRLDRPDHQRLARVSLVADSADSEQLFYRDPNATTGRDRRIHAWMLHMSTSQRPRR